MTRAGVKMLCGAALLAAAVGAGLAARAQTQVDLQQGWDGPTVTRWYGGFQGSRLVPEAWLRQLEHPGGTGKFLDPAYIASFRYLTDGASNLPVGFAIDIQDDKRLGATKLRWKPGQGSKEPWVGLTCSACHTAELRLGDRAMRVQGGPTLGDFQGLLEAFNQTLFETSDDPAKFKRFADGVLGPQATAAQRQTLKTAVGQLASYQLKLFAMNRTNLRYGYGRLDAVGHILNKVAFVAKPDGPTANLSDAPVSYPFLWNTSQQTRVQWNGIARNSPRTFDSGQTLDIGALGRNGGEVIGVFADVKAPSGFFLSTYRSSVQVQNLVSIEQQLMTLKPPRWPREIMPVDDALAAQGKVLFARDCARCHTPLARDDLATRTRPGTDLPLEQMTLLFAREGEPETIGTDPWMACNAATNQALTGKLKGKPVKPLGSEKLKAQDSSSKMLASMVAGVLVEKAADLASASFDTFLGTSPPPKVLPPGGTAIRPSGPADYAARRELCARAAAGPDFAVIAYKGRPLTGVWATGPFLHNGSVPTLHDLLLPPAERPAEFRLGTRQFDPVKVGFVTTPGPENTFVFRARDAAGQIIEGNSNLGHDYGNARLSAADRRALVEYMKVIGEQ